MYIIHTHTYNQSLETLTWMILLDIIKGHMSYSLERIQ